MEKRKEAGCALAASLLAGALALPTAALEVSQAWGLSLIHISMGELGADAVAIGSVGDQVKNCLIILM